jgi:hypothetical protein
VVALTAVAAIAFVAFATVWLYSIFALFGVVALLGLIWLGNARFSVTHNGVKVGTYTRKGGFREL